jgi:hypothetical protein
MSAPVLAALAAAEEIERIRRVSDSMCSAHAGLRDRYAQWALALDLLILGSSIWLVALSFVDERIGERLTPGTVDPHIWIGVLGVVTFFLSIVQLKTEWKSRAHGHKTSAEAYAAVKREANYLLKSGTNDSEGYKRVIDRYDMASVASVPIPEKDFLKQKRRHLIKIAISKHLDSKPSTWIFWLRVRLWWKDTFSSAA